VVEVYVSTIGRGIIVKNAKGEVFVNIINTEKLARNVKILVI